MSTPFNRIYQEFRRIIVIVKKNFADDIFIHFVLEMFRKITFLFLHPAHTNQGRWKNEKNPVNGRLYTGAVFAAPPRSILRTILSNFAEEPLGLSWISGLRIFEDRFIPTKYSRFKWVVH